MTDEEAGIVHRIAAQWCRERGIDEQNVEDIQQDVMLEVLERLHAFPDRNEAMLVRAAQWACGHVGRAWGRQQAGLPPIESLDDAGEEDDDVLSGYDRYEDNTFSPERALTENETRQVLDNFLSHLLPVEQRVVRTTYGLDDAPLTQAEIARQLEVSPAYVSRVHSQALRKLRGRNIAEVLGL